MRTCAGIGIVVSAVTLTLSSLTAVGGQADSGNVVRSILDGARRNRLAIPPLSMEIEVTKFKVDNDKYTQEVPIERLIKQYRRDGDHLELLSARYLPDGTGGFEDGDFPTRSIWDGQRALHRQGGSQVYGSVSKSDELSRRILFSDDGGGILDGFIPHNLFEGDWTRVFDEQLSRVRVRPQSVTVNGHACRVLEADTRYGNYTLWVDVAGGGCLRQAVVRVDTDDLAWGKPLGQSRVSKGHGENRCYTSLEMTLTDVVAESVGELFLPLAGTYVCRTCFDDGYEMTIRRTIARRNVVLHPDFEAMGAFQMDMPDGTIVFDLDVPGVRYQWFQGELVPYLREVVDDGIAALADHQLPARSEVVRSADVDNAEAAARRDQPSTSTADRARIRRRVPWELLLGMIVVAGIAVGFAAARVKTNPSSKPGSDA